MNTRRFGKIGEEIAQNYLLEKKYEILEKNFYTKKGEIDIIAKKNNNIVFVEVKTRSNLFFGTPAMSVNNIKKKQIMCVAKIYLYINKLFKSNVRFDIIEILLNDNKCEINHIENIM